MDWQSESPGLKTFRNILDDLKIAVHHHSQSYLGEFWKFVLRNGRKFQNQNVQSSQRHIRDHTNLYLLQKEKAIRIDLLLNNLNTLCHFVISKGAFKKIPS